LGIQTQTFSIFAVKKKQKHDKDSVRKILNKYKKQRLDSKHQASSSSPDLSHVSLAVDPEPSQEELLRLCREHLDRLIITADEI